jgi:predicted RNase H-like nuclease (RuvC/YqgF family)
VIELNPTEKFERARKSTLLSEERLVVIDKRLPELRSKPDDLIIKNELEGYKARTITRTREEIASLEKEKIALQQTISALQKKLPELETAAEV